MGGRPPPLVTIAGDVNGGGVSDVHVTLSGHFTLVVADFVL